MKKKINSPLSETGNATIYKDFRFDAAHFLPKVPKEHKCSRVHGHSWLAKIFISGPINDDGWVLDFARIDEEFAPLFNMLDHQLLNERIANPTSENVAKFIFDALDGAFEKDGASLVMVRIGETCRCGVEYVGG